MTFWFLVACLLSISEAAEQNNCAFCDKSTKLAIHVTKGVTKRFGYWATS